MKVHISGNVNQYYVQMLCMIFFPGEHFSESEEARDDVPVLDLSSPRRRRVSELPSGSRTRERLPNVKDLVNTRRE